MLIKGHFDLGAGEHQRLVVAAIASERKTATALFPVGQLLPQTHGALVAGELQRSNRWLVERAWLVEFIGETLDLG